MNRTDLHERIAALTPEQRRLLLAQLQQAAPPSTPKERAKLVAFVKTSGAAPNDLKERLKRYLPDYMIPANFIEVADFPRLPNGKIDQQALQHYQVPAEETTDIALPTTPLEKQLADIWEQVLDFAPIGLHDNFFEIGGDSILSIQIISKARNAGIELAANQLFEHQTIGELAAFISSKTMQKEADKTAEKTDPTSVTFPLTHMQEAFLFHHLQAEKDEGILHAQLVLEGDLQREKLEAAWQATIRQHPVMRTSVRWEGVEIPMQTIHEAADLEVVFEDCAEMGEAAFDHHVGQVKAGVFLDLTEAPVSQVWLFKRSEKHHVLLWSSHHLLLDGWSTALIIRDLFLNYEAIVLKNQRLETAIPPFNTYAEWKDGQDLSAAKTFWRMAFQKTDHLPLFKKHGHSAATDFSDHLFVLSQEKTDALKAFARTHRITPSNLVKGVWGLLLSRWFGERTATFGATVSGRSAPLAQIDQMTGLFMNILPVQLTIDEKTDFLTWVKRVQVVQGESIKFEQNTVEEIQNWIGAEQATLFDSLIVFENFPWQDLDMAGLRVSGFKGGVATTYPLNLMVIPLDPYEFVLRFDRKVLDNKTATWFADGIALLLDVILSSPKTSLGQLLEMVAQKTGVSALEMDAREEASFSDNVAPQNDLELKLLRIWEKVLGCSPLGVTDHFFEIGGSSLQAVRLLTQVKERLGHNLSPAQLMENPTIRQQAHLFQKGETGKAWSNLVALRASGSKPPLFCIHAGGGHSFFYKNLLPHLSESQPLYAFYAKGLDTGEVPQSAAEMARDYLEEAKKVNPDGPYIFLVYCFSVVVAMEISQLLQGEGQPAPMIIVVDTAPWVPQTRRLTTYERFVRYVFHLSLKDKWDAIIEKIRSRSGRLMYRGIKQFGNEQESILVKTQEALISIYDSYERKPFRGKITLIRATGTVEELKGNDWHLENWNSIALDGLDVHVVEGIHEQLFEEPDVQRLGKQVQVCLDGLV